MPLHFASVPEHGQRGNGADAEARSQLRDFFGIHLDDNPTTGAMGGDFGDFRREHLARTAPSRPKIDQNWQGRLADDRIETRDVAGIDRFGRLGKFGVALAAAEVATEAFVNQSVAAAALRAGADQSALVGFKVGCRRHTEMNF